MPRIVTIPNLDAAVSEIASAASSRDPRPRLIRLEGVCGAGKTNIARRLAAVIDGVHIEVDRYANKYDGAPPYPECIRQSELDETITRLYDLGLIIVLDAVCLEDVAPSHKWGRGVVVYVKQLSFNNSDPVWHDGINLEGDPPDVEPHRSVHFYHKRVRPHETADLIVELPQEGHSLPGGPFSRDLCFDPP